MFDVDLPASPQKRDTAINAYIENMVTYLKLKHPDKDENTLREGVKQIVRERINNLKANNKKAVAEGLSVEEAIKKYGKIYPTVKMVQATDPANPNPRKRSYGNLVEVPNMDILKFGSVYTDKIMSPFCSVYETTNKLTSFLTNKIIKDGAKRKQKKKCMLNAKKIGDMATARVYNNQQATVKINMNSTSGGMGCNGNFLSSPANYNSITSICRFFVMNSYAHAERFLEGNFYFATIEQITNHLVNCVRLGPSGEHVLEICRQSTVPLHIPTVDDVTNFLFDKLYRYNKNTPVHNKGEIRNIVSNLNQGQLTFVYYMSNLKNLIQANESFFRPWLDDFLTDVNVDYSQVYNLDEINKVDGDLITVISTVYNSMLPRNKKGNNISVYDCLNPQPEQGVNEAHPDIVQKFIAISKHMIRKLEQISPIFDLFMRHDVAISRIPEHKYMYRDAITLSDTDSIIFSTQHWVNWYTGSLAICDRAYAINAFIVFLLTKSTIYLQYQVSKRLGVCGKDLLTMNMKNEFMMPIEISTAAKKNYTSVLKIQEGVVFANPRLDIKGVNLRGSTFSPSTTAYTQWLIQDIVDSITNTGKVDPRKKILDVLRYERLILDDILAGNTTYLSIQSIKMANEYKDPTKSIYFNYQIWESVFAPKYGSILLPTKTYVLPVVNLADPSYIAYLEKVEPDTADRLKEAVDAFKDKDINLLPINSMLKEVPPILRKAIRTRGLIYSQTSPLYLIMKSLGINIGADSLKMRARPELFSDVYGWVTSEEAAKALPYTQ